MGKRVSWVELYLDLVFVLAVGRLAHLIVAHPEMHSVWVALGLFVTLWWTWVGFAVLYNRHGADELALRVLFLAGSVPAGVAAVAIDPASTGDSTVFALALWWLTSIPRRTSTSGCSSSPAGRRRWPGRSSPSGTCSRPSRSSSPASGVGLLIEEDPPRLAYWLACVGIGIYLGGTRAFMMGAAWLPGIVRTLVLVATFQLARLRPELSPYEYLWLLTGWVVMCAVLTTRTSGVGEDPDLERYFGSGRRGAGEGGAGG